MPPANSFTLEFQISKRHEAALLASISEDLRSTSPTESESVPRMIRMFRLALPMVTGLLLCGSVFAADKKLNVLFVVADDLRDHVGCYGNSIVKTPNIDRLAARGVRFDRAYVQYPVCNPSRTSFLTGLRPDQTGITDNATLLRDKQPNIITFPQLFRQNGWRTAALGKIFHLGGGRDPARQAKWADMPKSWDEARDFDATPAGGVGEGRDLTGGKLRWCRWGMAEGSDDDQPDGQAAIAGIKQIERWSDQPWLIAVGFQKPHDPFVAPKHYFDLYPIASLNLYRDPPDITAAPSLAVGFGESGEAFRRFTDRERLEFLRAYYAGTSFMDAQVGRLLDVLDQKALWDRTVVIFVSDHGYHLGERQWWNKNTLFERSCRAPLIIAAPGIKPGTARGLVEFVDLYPTVAELCGLTPPAGLAGQSVSPLLRDPTKPGKTAAFTMVKRGEKQRGESVRTDRWRFTQWSDGTRELYDHQNDPEEIHNVVDRAENKSTVEELSGKLTANER
jgi:iduronate 2-sulfatase